MRFWPTFLGGLLYAAAAFAFEPLPGREPIRAAACESYKPGESKSSLVIRTADKASFDAVAGMRAMADLRAELDDHDFNVMVYKIVDDMIEDLNIATTSQDAQGVCVEASGFVANANLVEAINAKGKTASESKAEVEKADTWALGEPEAEPAVAAEPEAEAQAGREAEAEAEAAGEPAEQAVPEPVLTAAGRAKVYVSPTEFYNSTFSPKYAEELKEMVAANGALSLAPGFGESDYTVASKVLRAKIEQLNASTNRLQMVVALEALSRDGSFSAVEHQNRFVLFKQGDDEQKIAAELMKKLFAKAGDVVLGKIEADSRKKAAPASPGAAGSVRRAPVEFIEPQGGGL